MTFLFDPPTAWASLLELEKGWGGTPSERLASKYQSYSQEYGTSAPKIEGDEAVTAAEEKDEPTEEAPVNEAAAPSRPEEPSPAVQSPTASPSLAPAAAPSPGTSPAP
jgi:penicillin-binding protein 2